MIGEETSERLDVIPAQYRVIVTTGQVRLQGVREDLEAPAPKHLIKSGLPTEAMVASVLVAKYGWHLPLYRQAQDAGLRRFTPPWMPPELMRLWEIKMGRRWLSCGRQRRSSSMVAKESRKVLIRCLGPKAADRLLEIRDCRGRTGKERRRRNHKVNIERG